MKFLKVKAHENCQMLAVVDDADNILTAAAFTSEHDVQAADDMIYTLLINFGILKAPSDIQRPATVDELLDITSKTFGDCEVYTAELSTD